ncbi:lipoxygenase homology domain-containing protein 1-like [Gigantopelta aegis]|uniref:lipoxygenase homology domain-containing protein 1-like n=1 Tax=Gigantopelta aegis TaxID=1735272 RepID=UPI001B88E099|nr:lipoxygenase homology domain-containing protein 1-like [Gigantopelta aegis]
MNPETEVSGTLKESLKKFTLVGDCSALPDQFSQFVEPLANLDTVLTSQKEKTSRYEVIIHTSDVPFAGTDADVYLVLMGEKTSSAVYTLGRQARCFERGMMNVLKLDAENVGSLKELVIGHNSKGVCPDWHLDKVSVVKYLNKTEQEARLSELRDDPHCPEGVFHENGLIAKLPFTDRFYFHCGQWLNKKNGIRKLVCSKKETEFVETHLPGTARDEQTDIQQEVKGLDPTVSTPGVVIAPPNEEPQVWIVGEPPAPRIGQA